MCGIGPGYHLKSKSQTATSLSYLRAEAPPSARWRADQLHAVADGCDLGLDLPTLRTQGGTFSFEVRQGRGLTLPLGHENLPALPLDRRERGGGLAAPGCLRNRGIDLGHPGVEVGDVVGLEGTRLVARLHRPWRHVLPHGRPHFCPCLSSRCCSLPRSYT
jgi:hypothetical protein